MAIKYGTIDSTMSLAVAFFINAAILILAAAAFFYKPGMEHQVCRAHHRMYTCVCINGSMKRFTTCTVAEL